MLDFFKKLQNLEYRLAIPQDNSYQRTHPLSGERIANLTQDVQTSPAFKVRTDPAPFGLPATAPGTTRQMLWLRRVPACTHTVLLCTAVARMLRR